jgi:flagellar hook protein FlgE
MLRSMYSGIGGLRNFQTKLDVIGNNIANVNTPGFKKSRTTFQDILSQTQAGGNGPTATPERGGTNPKQVGLGSTLATIDVIHTQGGAMTTNYPSDLSIEGNGFFVVSPTSPGTPPIQKENYYLTRAGNFTVDADGNFVTSNGMFVLGLQDDGSGNITLSKINLYDIAGINTSDRNQYQINSYSIGKNGEITVIASKKDGTPSTLTPLKTYVGVATVNNPAGLEKNGSNLYRVTSSANSDGAGNGATDLTDDATVAGVYIGQPNSGNRGPVLSGQLEMSNVDLAEEFTEMIVAQRGFQANSRTITTSDSILEELVNLKR